MGIADLGGVWLVTFVTILCPALFLTTKSKRRFVPQILAAALVLVVQAYGVARSHRPPPTAGRLPPLRIAAVQPLVPFKVGPKADPEAMLREQRHLTAQVEPGSVDLIVWSETMVPGDLLEEIPETLAPVAREKRCFLLAGGVVHEKDAAGNLTGRAFNSAVLLDPQGRLAGRYDKRHLVPFGEYVPLGGKFPGARAIFDLIGTVFTPAETEAPLPEIAGVKLGVNICYEDAFPEIPRRDAARGARLLVNLTNDSWFRQTSEARQHLALAALRAVETRTPMVRATNTGITALIDADGRVTVPPGGGLWEKGLLRMEIAVPECRSTAYLAVGDLFAWLCVAASVIAAVFSGRFFSRRCAPDTAAR
jgi:apolipoprotein N-acyltransferase